MVNLAKKFNIGDKVFAKVRGYPPWPARIEKVIDPNTKNAKYNVYFYGTGETASCKVDELFDYLENKAKYGKVLRRKFFNEGIQELEKELGIVSPASPVVKSKEISEVSTPQDSNISYKSDDGGANESVLTACSDTESKLVIDEREPKKGLKRKATASSQNNTPDTVETKKRKVSRLSDVKKSQKQSQAETPKLETPRDTESEPHDGETPTGKEMVSRSGRKIKPKRYTDFADLSETPKTGTAENKDTNNSTAAVTPLSNKQSTESSNYVLTKTFKGDFVGIKLKFGLTDLKVNGEQWDWSVARDVLKLKTQLESGQVLPEQVKDKLDFSVAVTEDDKRSVVKDNAFLDKCKSKWLRVQREMCDADVQVRSTLALDQANPDECLEVMDTFFQLPIDPLMLKNFPVVVETVKRLRCYVGNLEAWGFNDEQTNTFNKKAEQIRQKADKICNRFKAMFSFPPNKSFWEALADEILQYQKLTENLAEEDKMTMLCDPSKGFSNELSKGDTDERTNSDWDQVKKEIKGENEMDS